MTGTRKIATFALSISTISLSLLTVVAPTTAAADWPWDEPTAAADSVVLVVDDWPWDGRTDGASWSTEAR
jgi:hypothetical protein